MILDFTQCKEDDSLITHIKYEYENKGWFFSDKKKLAITNNYNILVTVPKKDFRHLAEKIRYPLSWWESARFITKTFRSKFQPDRSLIFICCDKLIIGFFYGEFQYGEDFRAIYFKGQDRGGYYLRSDERVLEFPNEIKDDEERLRRIIVLSNSWACIDPIPVNYVPRAPIEPRFNRVTVLEDEQSFKRVNQWNRNIRINPKDGKWSRVDYRSKKYKDND